MKKLTAEVIENGRQGDLSVLGKAIQLEMELCNATLQEIVNLYSDMGLYFHLAKIAIMEYKIDQEITMYCQVNKFNLQSQKVLGKFRDH